ncbi:MAG TPA: hypothetical protein HPP76_05500 [Desulfuromonadales bacterium]|nr:hypothetical protein [Desulfuromonadales bacterium]
MSTALTNRQHRPIYPGRHPQDTFLSLAIESLVSLVSTIVIIGFTGGFAYLLYLLFLKELG